MRNKIISGLMASVVLMLMLTSCSKPQEDLVGSWTECVKWGQKDSVNRGNASVFLFEQDGTFKGRNIPIDIFYPMEPKRIDFSGRWQINHPSQDFLALTEIDLYFKIPAIPGVHIQTVLYMAIDHQELADFVETPDLILKKSVEYCPQPFFIH